MRQPLQPRSEASLEKLISAGDRLVRRDGFHGTSINRLCAEAGLTSGAFYARFSRKEDLAFPLLERLRPGIESVIDGFAADLANTSLDDSVRGLITGVLGVYQRDGDLLRELVALAPRNKKLANAMRQTNEAMLQRLVGVVLDGPTPVSHPRPRQAVTLGLVTVFNTLRELALERTVFESSGAFPDDFIVDELSRMFGSYLNS